MTESKNAKRLLLAVEDHKTVVDKELAEIEQDIAVVKEIASRYKNKGKFKETIQFLNTMRAMRESQSQQLGRRKSQLKVAAGGEKTEDEIGPEFERVPCASGSEMTITRADPKNNIIYVSTPYGISPFESRILSNRVCK